MITHLHERALFRSKGNLGLGVRVVRWLGIGGMRWEQLLPKLQYEILNGAMPAFIVIQLGGNNIVDIKLDKLINTIRHDIRYICTVYEKINIVWSDILPRKLWRGASEIENVLKNLDIKRKRINRLGRQTVQEFENGRSISSDIDLFEPGFFRPDGTHLTDIANDILLNTYEEAFNAFINNPDQTRYEA